MLLVLVYPTLKTIQGIGGVYIILRNKRKFMSSGDNAMGDE